MGDGVIDGRGYAKLLGKDYSWWEMARKAEPRNERYFTTRMIVASHADGLVLYRITLHNSTNFHVSVNQSNGFTAWAVHLLTPTTKGIDARNTDGIDPGSSTNVTVAHSWIDNGDDNIAIKTGTTHMSVLDKHFYSGHGMSIGSETNGGVSNVNVYDLSIDGTNSGQNAGITLKNGQQLLGEVGAGVGTLTLGGASTYSGGTAVSAGTLWGTIFPLTTSNTGYSASLKT